MDDLIRRQDVIDAILSEPHNEPRYPDWWVQKVMEIKPRRGKWTEKEVIDNKNGKVVDELQSERCDQCGRYNTTPYMYYFKEDNYCPYCGAKME